MIRYLEIAVNVPHAAGVFHYHAPPELASELEIGHLVTAPFGSRTVQGVIVGEVEQPEVAETRPLIDLVDPAAVVTPQQIALARRMAHESLAPLSACISLMLPPGVGQQADTLYTLSAGSGKAPQEITEAQRRLLKLLEKRGPLRGQQIERSLSRMNWRPAARALERRGLLTTQPFLAQPKVHPKMERTAQLACPPEQALAALPKLGRAGSAALERRQKILGLLITEPGAVDTSRVYAESGGDSSDLRFLSERGLVQLGERQTLRDSLQGMDFQPDTVPSLTQAQSQVWSEVLAALHQAAAGEGSPPFLLHGVTGSGKTEIYLQAVRATLEMGRQAIVLVPEIALTPQTVRRFVGRFSGQVGLVHSGLSPGERYDTWRRARSGELSLVVGPRSALFTPFNRLGLIVVDECHDDSYYQAESPPYYHARETAVQYARLAGAICLMGSATPSISSRLRCEQGEWRYLHLPERILAHRGAVRAQMQRLQSAGKSPQTAASHFQPLEAEAESIELPPVNVVDMRQELKDGNRSIFSRALQAALEQVLALEQQAILFLNRRGSATYVFCRDCGLILKCAQCDLPLTYHEALGMLRCHSCSYQRRMPAQCPQCGSARVRHFGTGTQRVEAEVQAQFPQARTLRWDHDTARTRGAHDAILSEFASQRANILIGTQMLAKGLDLPLVTLVGVVLADVGLSLPDFHTNERAFQILTQVAGRAGRSPLGGQVILQTFQPEHYVIQAASRHDYESFYRQELEYRRRLAYPPFTRLVRLEYRHSDAARAESAARNLAQQIQEWMEQDGLRATRLIGPAPCFFGRVAGQYRWQIVLNGPDPAGFLRGRNLREWKVEVNPTNLL